MATGRGRLSSFDRLPPETEGIVQDAQRALAAREKTQVEIYAEFVTACQRLMAERELDFDIPAIASFNRFSMRKAQLARRLSQTNEIVAVLAEKWDAQASDDLTVITAEAIKAIVLHMLGDATEGMDPKDAMHLANAFRAATQAQNVSSDRRLKLQKEFASRLTTAVDAAAKAKGMTAETAEEIKAMLLGVET